MSLGNKIMHRMPTIVYDTKAQRILTASSTHPVVTKEPVEVWEGHFEIVNKHRFADPMT